MRGEADGRICVCRGAVRRTGEFVFAEERRGERENLCPAEGGEPDGRICGGIRRPCPFGGTASGKTDAAGSRGRIPTSGEGTDSQIPPSGSRRAGLAVCARIYVRIDPAALSPHAVLPVPRRAIMSVPRYAENLPFSRRRWRGAGISANYFVICVVKTTEFGFSETKLSVRCAAADRFYSAQAIRSADGEKAAQIMKRRFPDTAVGKRPKQRHINAIPLF